MKKLLLTGLLVLSTMTFAAKITTTGKSWEKIEKEYRVPEVKEESILVFNWSDENNDTYHFRIIKSDLKKNNDFYLMEFYEDKNRIIFWRKLYRTRSINSISSTGS